MISNEQNCLEMDTIPVRVTVFLTVCIFILRVICGECVMKKMCDDPTEILKSIKAYPDNYQQLLNAFYPVNRAKPSDVIIAYFINYTDPLPEECSLGTYPWRTYPGINSTYYRMMWFMWTTTPIRCVGTDYTFLEFGEYLPTISFYLLFNMSSPFYRPSPIACIKTPPVPVHGDYGILGDVTTQILSTISRQLQRQYEEKSSGVLYMHLASENWPQYDVRLYNYMPQGGRHNSLTGVGFYILIGTLGYLAPFLLYAKGRQLVKSLQRSRSKTKVPFFWAVAILAHVFNVYILFKILIAAYHPYRPDKFRMKICITTSITSVYLATLSIPLAYIHSKYITFSIPKTWSIFTKCWGRNQNRIITTISLWGIYMSVVFILGCLPFQFLLASANPHLYGFAILTVWCAMFVCIIVTSIPFTFDQIFIKEEEYRITPKQALRQILLLMFIAVLVFGFGSLTFSITLVLHLSKYGEKTQGFQKSVYFVLRYTALPIASWMIQVLYHKGKETVQQVIPLNQ